MDTKKLRQKILDLAIRGKLVPQDPNDEPASVLLERIRAEKEQLIKEGKIKRSKKSAATDKSHYENVPFEIPESWVLSDFSELVTLLSGRDLESNDCNSNREGIPYLIGASNIVDGKINITRWTTKPLVISKRGDILISCKGTIGEVVTNVIGEIHIARQFMAIQTSPMVYADYIELYIKSIVNNIKRNARGVIPGISREDILHREIALPPLEEQKRIVIEVEKWLDFIADIEAEKDELESHIKQTKSKILDLAISGKLVPQDPNDEPAIELLKRINPSFEPCDNSHYENLPFEVPDGWCWAKINDVTEFIKNGAQIKQFKGASGIPITRIETISNSELDMARMGYANITNGAEYKDYYIKDGDILMSHINSRAHIGKCALCNVGENQIIHGMNLLRIRCSKQILPEYMVYYFRSTTFYNLIEPHIKNAVNQASINITNLQKILIPIPPYSEQRRVAFIVDKLFSTIDTITAEL